MAAAYGIKWDTLYIIPNTNTTYKKDILRTFVVLGTDRVGTKVGYVRREYPEAFAGETNFYHPAFMYQACKLISLAKGIVDWNEVCKWTYPMSYVRDYKGAANLLNKMSSVGFITSEEEARIGLDIKLRAV